jgi:hypothetical protein
MDIKDEKNPLEKFEIKTPDGLFGLLGDPPLLAGEDPDLYWSLLAWMIKDRKPQIFSEWVYVHDTVSKLWEEQRLKRASTGLMRAEMFKALKYFLPDIHADGNLKKPLQAEKLVFMYFSGNPKERQEVVSLLAKYGITEAVLQAKAAQENIGLMQMFEVMYARRGKERRKLRQEDEAFRRRRDSGKE